MSASLGSCFVRLFGSRSFAAVAGALWLTVAACAALAGSAMAGGTNAAGPALSALVLSSGRLTPSFATSTLSYATYVPIATTSISVTPTSTDPTSSIRVNGVTVLSGAASQPLSLQVGSNPVSVTVMSQDGLSVTIYSLTVHRTNATSVKSDFNGDRRTDLVWDDGAGSRWLFAMNGASVASSAPLPGAAPGWQITGIGDFNGDGSADLLWKNPADDGAFWIYLMSGSTMVGSAGVRVAPGYLPRFVADFDGDGRADILWQNATGERWIYFMNGTTVATYAALPSAAPGWSLAFVGDFNGDGNTDLLWQSDANSSKYWTWMLDGATVIGGGPLSMMPGYTVTHVADVNGDGWSELIEENGAGLRFAIFFPTLGGYSIGGAAPGWTLAALGDFNGDGFQDLLWHNSAAPSEYWIHLLAGNQLVGSRGFSVVPGYSLLMPRY